jgi:hypothetical protein
MFDKRPDSGWRRIPGVVVRTSLLFLICGCGAPTERQWQMVFVTPGNEEVVMRITTSDLFSGNSSPSTLRVSQADDVEYGALQNLSSFEQRRVIDDVPLIARPRCSGYFTLKNEATGEIIGGARTGHSYSSLWGISPCGEYLAYFVPGALWRRSYVHHLKSDRRAVISIPARWRIKSWTEHGELTKTTERVESGAVSTASREGGAPSGGRATLAAVDNKPNGCRPIFVNCTISPSPVMVIPRISPNGLGLTR